MKPHYLILFAFLLVQSIASAQDLIMQLPTSADANGMGAIAASFASDNATATIANPAQLGMFSLNGILNASTYLTKTNWSSSPYMSLNASALNVGINLSNFFSMPFQASVGLGYSTVFFDLGSIETEYGISPWKENQECYTIGAGFDWIVRLGMGYSLKIGNSIEPGSDVFNTSSQNSRVYTHDYGVMMQLPLSEIVSRLSGKPIMLFPAVKPFVDINLGYSKRNIGGYAIYPLLSDSFPQPRTATLGLNFELGLRTQVGNKEWTLLSFVWAREAENTMVKATAVDDTSMDYPFYEYGYASGFGTFKPIANLILGKIYGVDELHKGWQIGAAEFIYIRGGSVENFVFTYYTFGTSIKLNGFIRLLSVCGIVNPGTGFTRFFLDHIDLQYHSSVYKSGYEPGLDGTKFQAINLVVR